VSGFAFQPVRVVAGVVVCEARCRVFGRFPGYVTLRTAVDLDTRRETHAAALHVDLAELAGDGDADLELEGAERPSPELAVSTLLATLQALRWAVALPSDQRAADCRVLEPDNA
jgi:hypothetical protein